MCGIAGYIGPRLIPESRIESCLELLDHRGPDAQGRFRSAAPSGQHVLLLHRRLAILDLDSRSDQPFGVDGYVLAFNGELYNYRELTQELLRDGARLATSGDTEVFARLLADRGVDGLSDAEGMWALAWYDSDAGTLLLARDRFGEKPLLICHEADGGLYFASEVQALAALAGRRFPADADQLRRFLVNGYKSLFKSTATFLQGVRALPAGSVGFWQNENGYGERPWWTPRFGEHDEDMSFNEAVAGTRERLMRSVELRLRADVPVAFLLSGGIDSNAMISLATRALGQDVHGFTIMNTDRRYEEAELVTYAVDELGIAHTAVELPRGGFLEQLREQVRSRGAPVLTISSYASWRLLETVRAGGFRVVVTGVGADELFSGYYDHHNAYLAEMASTDPVLHDQALSEWRRTAGSFVRNPFLQDPSYFVRSPMSRSHIYLDAPLLAQALRSPFAEPFTELMLAPTLLRNRMANELLAEAVPVLLHEDDLNAMYHAIENRSPFLDTALFNFSTRIPTRHLVRYGLAKAVLREAVRGIAPPRVLDNPRKVGFNAPIGELLDLTDPSTKRLLLADSPIFELVRPEAVIDLLSDQPLGNSRSKLLFNIISAKIFLEEVAA